MSLLLFDEQPLVISKLLALKLGLNESIIVQQIHYWNEKNKESKRNLRDGYYWTYSSYEQWNLQFPFWSISTIRRTLSSLEKSGIVVSSNYNKMRNDKTKWYRIDYDKLNNACYAQNEQTDCSFRTNRLLKLNKPLPENITENKAESLYSSTNVDDNIQSQCSCQSLDAISKLIRNYPMPSNCNISKDYLLSVYIAFYKTLTYYGRYYIPINPQTVTGTIELLSEYDCIDVEEFMEEYADTDFHVGIVHGINHYLTPTVFGIYDIRKNASSSFFYDETSTY